MSFTLRVQTLTALLVATAFFSSGCGILIGNVKPVSEKAEDYQVLDLSKGNSDWIRLDSQQDDADNHVGEEGTARSDLAYQSQRTASIISLNSACREKFKSESHDLKEFTHQLLLGISDVKSRQQKEIQIKGNPALDTTIQGKMGDQPVKIRAVVVKNDRCLYDLMYVARPDQFAEQEQDFSRFVESLRLR